jgi:prepilin signal peptidase PulO-like enzyme (type II secretory pathway)
MHCNRDLRWYALIPILSFLTQSGKCRRCASKISHQYPLVEFGTGLVFALVAFKLLPILEISFWVYFFATTFFVFIFSLLIVISVYDLRHKIIPDKLVFLFIIISFLSIFINYSGFGHFFVLPTITDLIAGPILSIPFVFLWLFSKGKLMGLGDGKLILGIGWLLGLYTGLGAVILSFWIGTIISLSIMYLSKKKMNMKTEIPFAPFLIISTLIVFLFSLDIFSLVNLFSI